MLTTTPQGFPNDRGRVFGPYEWRGMTIPLGDVVLDVAHERPHGLERRAADRLARQDPKPGLHDVEPRRAFGGEVKLDLRVGAEPRQHVRRGMRRRVVEHDVDGAADIAAWERL